MSDKYQVPFEIMQLIDVSYKQASDMSVDELTTALAELKLEGGEHIASLESAVKGEAIHRLNHPFTWRIERWFLKLKRA